MIWRFLIAALLGLHGLIHLIGSAATWRLGQPTVVSAVPGYPAGLAVGGVPARALGVLWLVATLGFLLAAVGLASETSWWRGLGAAAAVLSLLLCLAWWNDAKAGAIIDVAILIGLAIATWVPGQART